MLFGYVAASIAGFLLTAVPNWTGRLPVNGAPLAALWALWIVGRFAMLLSGQIGGLTAAVIDVAFLAALAAVAAREIIAGKNWRNLRVLIVVGILVAGNVVFHAEVLLNGTADYGVRLSIGATNVASGNFRYFDSALERIRPEHVLASGALPPAFPAVVVDGEHYWDGGLVSNTPLEYVLESVPRRDTLVLQVDLWSARGPLPRNLLDVLEREKDIQYSSRTRQGTDQVAARQRLRNALGLLLERIPDGSLPAALHGELAPWLCDRVFNIVHLIYRAKSYEEQYKDYAFGPATMREHWASGRDDMHDSLARPEFFSFPDRGLGVVTHDIHRAHR
jgi:predicted acylesterase/phospholipase RssA